MQQQELGSRVNCCACPASPRHPHPHHPHTLPKVEILTTATCPTFINPAWNGPPHTHTVINPPPCGVPVPVLTSTRRPRSSFGPGRRVAGCFTTPTKTHNWSTGRTDGATGERGGSMSLRLWPTATTAVHHAAAATAAAAATLACSWFVGITGKATGEEDGGMVLWLHSATSSNNSSLEGYGISSSSSSLQLVCRETDEGTVKHIDNETAGFCCCSQNNGTSVKQQDPQPNTPAMQQHSHHSPAEHQSRCILLTQPLCLQQ